MSDVRKPPFATLADACRAAISAGKALALTRTWDLDGTCAARLYLFNGGIIKPGSGHTAVLSGPIDGDRTQHFDNSVGGISLTAPTLAIYPEWFSSSSDFRTEFNAAVPLLPPGAVLLLTKPYTLSGGPLMIDGTTKITIQCEGSGSITAAAAGYHGFEIGSVKQSMGTVIRDCPITGKSVVGSGTQYSNIAVHVQNAPETQILQNEITYWNRGIICDNSANDGFIARDNTLDHILGTTSNYGYGIVTVGSGGFIDHNRMTNIGRHGVYCAGNGTIGACRNNLIEYNYISGTAFEAIAVAAFYHTPASPAVRDNQIRYNVCRDDLNCVGISQNSRYNTISYNVSLNSGSFAYFLNSTTFANGQVDHNSLIGNLAIDSGDDGFNLLYASDNLLENNFAIGGKHRGFEIGESAAHYSTGNILRGNFAFGNNNYGFFLGPRSENSVFQGNFAYGNGFSDAYFVDDSNHPTLTFENNTPAQDSPERK